MSAAAGTGGRGLTISELEARSGVSRGVIYYYVHRGLLPPAQKARTTRALYNERHAELLAAIAELKNGGLTLQQIGERLADRIGADAGDEIDLVAHEERRRRDVILEEAARQFAARGYRNTRVADICEALGIAPRTLYSHFRTKQALFVACYHVYADWLAQDVEPHVEEETDPAARLVWRMRASIAIQAFGPDLQALAQAASVHDDGELQEMVQETYRVITERAEADLAAVHSGGGAPPPLSEELAAMGLQGAFERMLMRVAWDDEYDSHDAMRTHLVLYLALEAVLQGRVDISARLAEVEPLLDEVSRRPLSVPPPAGA
ncbi:MAG TPA: TetR family transcriptional regulator [Thermoleophilia bacterium]|nr:TetR family transcriptional regulator [Thermoleophilia bacterium]